MSESRTPAVAAGYLHNAVTKLRAEEVGVVEAARLKHRARIDALIAKAPEEVQRAFRKLDVPTQAAGTERQ